MDKFFQNLPAPLPFPTPVDSFVKIGSLRKVMFVLNMNWPRMGSAARRTWIWNLRRVCEDIIMQCDDYLKSRM